MTITLLLCWCWCLCCCSCHCCWCCCCCVFCCCACCCCCPGLARQGGFLVIKPSLRDYQRLVDIVMEGHYHGSGAWGGTKIGWFWGGKTIQGLLAYYYQVLALTSDAFIGYIIMPIVVMLIHTMTDCVTHALDWTVKHVEDRGRGLRVDRCLYNTMADSDRCRSVMCQPGGSRVGWAAVTATVAATALCCAVAFL